MPASALLPLTIALSVLFLIVAVILWLRGRRGRGVQFIGLALLAPALYLTGLLTLLWNAITALGAWGSQLAFNPAVWTGFGLLAGTVLMWFIGGRLAARNALQRAQAKNQPTPVQQSSAQRQVAASKAKPTAKQKAQPAKSAEDVEMDEIEALLRSRGIE